MTKKLELRQLHEKKPLLHSTTKNGLPSIKKPNPRMHIDQSLCPYVIEKVLPNDIYFVRRISKIKTQGLHRIRLRKKNSEQPLHDSYQKEQLQRCNKSYYRKTTSTL